MRMYPFYNVFKCFFRMVILIDHVHQVKSLVQSILVRQKFEGFNATIKNLYLITETIELNKKN